MLARLARALEKLFDTSEGKRPAVCSMRSFELVVRCTRCGEVIPVRIDRDHELQSTYGADAAEGDPPIEYTLRKELVGEGCQSLIRFTIRFDCDHGLLDSEIVGGEFVDAQVVGRTPLEERAELTT